jgi:hypothetical protein
MNKLLALIFTLLLFETQVKSQTAGPEFDTAQFAKRMEFATWLIDYEYFTQLGSEKFIHQPEKNVPVWFSYNQDKTWFIVGGHGDNEVFNIIHHLQTDSLPDVTEYKGSFDTSMIKSTGIALIRAEKQFQLIRDTSNLFYNSFAFVNPDQTISIWYLPALQPSGQAVYGCEWEYIFDKSGVKLIRLNSVITKTTGVWIGQPRELWLNFRNTDTPTVGSIFFALSFRDFFTRLRIDTRTSTSTTTLDNNGNYTWNHKMK